MSQTNIILSTWINKSFFITFNKIVTKLICWGERVLNNKFGTKIISFKHKKTLIQHSDVNNVTCCYTSKHVVPFDISRFQYKQLPMGYNEEKKRVQIQANIIYTDIRVTYLNTCVLHFLSSIL